jgi:hypothetical protein
VSRCRERPTTPLYHRRNAPWSAVYECGGRGHCEPSNDSSGVRPSGAAKSVSLRNDLSDRRGQQAPAKKSPAAISASAERSRRRSVPATPPVRWPTAASACACDPPRTRPATACRHRPIASAVSRASAPTDFRAVAGRCMAHRGPAPALRAEAAHRRSRRGPQRPPPSTPLNDRGASQQATTLRAVMALEGRAPRRSAEAALSGEPRSGALQAFRRGARPYPRPGCPTFCDGGAEAPPSIGLSARRE